MENKTLKKIFDFLEDKENKKNKNKGTLRWKLFFNEPLTKDDLIVENLNLANLKITSLPEGLEIKDYLNLYNCTNLTSLPKGLKVGGYLSLDGCVILQSLPKGLRVGGSLDLYNCTSLTSLPKGLKVEENLYLLKTPLAKLSDSVLLKMIGSDGYIKGKIVR